MQQTIQFGQVVQPSVLSQVKAAVKNLRVWWQQKSETFTLLCATEEGEQFTHGEVVKAHAFLAFLFMMMCVAGWLEGGAA